MDVDLLLQKVYTSIYGRPADPAGLAFWRAVTKDATDLDPMVEYFAKSEEYEKRFDGKSEEEQVEQIYLDLFGREADAEGKAFWLEKLQSGELTITNIAFEILKGAEAETGSPDDRLLVANKAIAAERFTTMLEEDTAEGGKLEQKYEEETPGAFEFGRDLLSSITTDPDSIPSKEAMKLAFADAVGEDGEVDSALLNLLAAAVDDDDSLLDQLTGEDGVLDELLGHDGVTDALVKTLLGDGTTVPLLSDVPSLADDLLDGLLANGLLNGVLGNDGLVENLLEGLLGGGDGGLLGLGLTEGLLGGVLGGVLGGDNQDDILLVGGLLGGLTGDELPLVGGLLGGDLLGNLPLLGDLLDGNLLDGLLGGLLGGDGDGLLDGLLGNDGLLGGLLDGGTDEVPLVGSLLGGGEDGGLLGIL